MEMSMQEYDTLIGWKFLEIGDIHQMIKESGDYRYRWSCRILYPTHGKQTYYQSVYYRINDDKAVLCKDAYPRYEYLLAKAAGRYWKLTNEVTKAKLDQINSFIDRVSDDGIRNAYFDMKTWKQIPVETPFWIVRTEGKAEFSLTPPVAITSEPDDELPW